MAATTARQFAELTTPHISRLFRIGMRLTRQPAESDDLVQEALTKAWVSWPRFKAGGSLGAWLSRILVNTFISKHRHQKVVDRTAARPDILGHLFDPHRLENSLVPERQLAEQGFSDEVLRALDQLPEAYRDVIEEVDIRGQSYKEAAEALNIPVGTVMSRLHRGRRRLREDLETYARQIGA